MARKLGTVQETFIKSAWRRYIEPEDARDQQIVDSLLRRGLVRQAGPFSGGRYWLTEEGKTLRNTLLAEGDQQ